MHPSGSCPWRSWCWAPGRPVLFATVASLAMAPIDGTGPSRQNRNTSLGHGRSRFGSKGSNFLSDYNFQKPLSANPGAGPGISKSAQAHLHFNHSSVPAHCHSILSTAPMLGGSYLSKAEVLQDLTRHGAPESVLEHFSSMQAVTPIARSLSETPPGRP